MQALWLSIVRTIVPLVVGGALTVAATWGLELDPEFEGALTAVLYGVFTAVYYIGVRLFETYLSPKLGWLLGSPKSPDHYTAASPVDEYQPKHLANPDGTHVDYIN